MTAEEALWPPDPRRRTRELTRKEDRAKTRMSRHRRAPERFWTWASRPAENYVTETTDGVTLSKEARILILEDEVRSLREELAREVAEKRALKVLLEMCAAGNHSAHGTPEETRSEDPCDTADEDVATLLLPACPSW